MKLELKHIAPYLPYEIEVISNERSSREVALITSLNYGLDQDLLMLQGNTEQFDFFEDRLEKVKPILRPLSDLHKHEDVYSELYKQCRDIDENLDYICEFYGDLINTSLSHRAVSILIKHHFDVFGLIPNNLAIDINTLEQ